MDKIISQLIELQQKPEPFAPGEPLFWNDPHIQNKCWIYTLIQMLKPPAVNLKR